MAVIDDHRLLGAALAAALGAMGFDVTSPALDSADDVLGEMSERRPAVALVDLDLGAMGPGEELIAPLRELGARVVVLSGTTDQLRLAGCICLGAEGFLPKTIPLDRLMSAVVAVAAGEPLIGLPERERLRRLAEEGRARSRSSGAAFKNLSRSEAEVLSDLVDGKAVRRIAAERFRSEATVRSQVRGILMKLGATSQLEAVAMARQADWSPGRRATS